MEPEPMTMRNNESRMFWAILGASLAVGLGMAMFTTFTMQREQLTEYRHRNMWQYLMSISSEMESLAEKPGKSARPLTEAELGEVARSCAKVRSLRRWSSSPEAAPWPGLILDFEMACASMGGAHARGELDSLAVATVGARLSGEVERNSVPKSELMPMDWPPEMRKSQLSNASAEVKKMADWGAKTAR